MRVALPRRRRGTNRLGSTESRSPPRHPRRVRRFPTRDPATTIIRRHDGRPPPTSAAPPWTAAAAPASSPQTRSTKRESFRSCGRPFRGDEEASSSSRNRRANSGCSASAKASISRQQAVADCFQPESSVAGKVTSNGKLELPQTAIQLRQIAHSHRPPRSDGRGTGPVLPESSPGFSIEPAPVRLSPVAPPAGDTATRERDASIPVPRRRAAAAGRRRPTSAPLASNRLPQCASRRPARHVRPHPAAAWSLSANVERVALEERRQFPPVRSTAPCRHTPKDCPAKRPAAAVATIACHRCSYRSRRNGLRSAA